MILLTDASVLIHDAGGKYWLRLTPSNRGDYATGAWSSAIPMAHQRLFFASGVLKDGRVYAVGGEESDDVPDTPLGEIFDPSANAWALLKKPKEFDFIQGDASSCILADGRVLFGNLHTSSQFPNRTAVWDPFADTWSVAGTAFGSSGDTKQSDCNEETWTLLPDGSVLTVEVWNVPQAERYIPKSDKWVSAGATPQSLVLAGVTEPGTDKVFDPDEIGPAILLPDGAVFAIGATGHTAIYTLDATNAGGTGTWEPGPDFPNVTNPMVPLMTAIDAPACLLPSGKVICVAGPVIDEPNANDPTASPFWSKPTNFYVYDPSTNKITPLADSPPNGANSGETNAARLLLLPTGEMLYSTYANEIYIYTPDPADGLPRASWKPTITSCPKTLQPGQSYTIAGAQLNGLSQANSYGDDAQMATNFPLVRVKNTSSGVVRYFHTSDFSTMGVATKDAGQNARFAVPADVPSGSWSLCIVANGIASDPVLVQVTRTPTA